MQEEKKKKKKKVTRKKRRKRKESKKKKERRKKRRDGEKQFILTNARSVGIAMLKPRQLRILAFVAVLHAGRSSLNRLSSKNSWRILKHMFAEPTLCSCAPWES